MEKNHLPERLPAENLFLSLRYLFAACIFSCSFYFILLYVSSDYASFLQALLSGVRRMSDYEDHYRDPVLKMIFVALKWVLAGFLILLSAWLYDWCFLHRSRLSRPADKRIRTVVSVFTGNRDFVRGLDPFTRCCLGLIFGLQAGALLFFLVHTPFHYDEAWTYVYFTGRGFLQTATFYPLPNNHIFYNLVAGLFTRLPFGPEVCTRLPGLCANFIATWYFFKLAAGYFPRTIAVLTTLAFSAAYPVILYSVEARGYSFLICFAVLLCYAAEGLVRSPDSGRLRLLFFFSVVAGLYTMPSFLFAVFVINMILLIYYAVNGRWREGGRFLLDNVIAVGIVALLYAPVIYLNGLKVLTNPNGSSVTSYHEVARLILPHLSSTWSFLLGSRRIPLAAILLLVIPALPGNPAKGTRGPFFVRFSLLVLLSPAFILFLYPVIPFERTWVYLAGPLFFSIGFFAAFGCRHLGDLMRRIAAPGRSFSAFAGYRQPVFFGLIAGLLLLSYANFKTTHHKQYAIDYTIRDQFDKMGHTIDHITGIGYTGRSLEYYVAEDLFFQCFKRNPLRTVVLDGPQKTADLDYTQSVLIIAPDSVVGMKLGGYEFVGSYEDVYSLFVRREHP